MPVFCRGLMSRFGGAELLRPLASYTQYDHKTNDYITPRTADYRHTRQDRWIQREMAFTVANNATKPNPIEITTLQTTRKENNWKTEEALARAAVTLETERIKGSNPWCLWWWSFDCKKIVANFIHVSIIYWLNVLLKTYVYKQYILKIWLM